MRIPEGFDYTFEHKQGDQVHNFHVEELVKVAEEGLYNSHSKQIRRTIPRNVGQGVKFSRDARDGCADDVGVQPKEKNAKTKRADNNS
ncbi:hypothetical protein N0V93_002579 [Gnomoniopsis smithogilvyi]|uniref:Uncharacterized protein n=1 Tax=Gnomoniopsis smithogilvyi TaxID=1191159 RepID=A0A9W9CYB9_9PEZI|nr:hypothetical protein N0V93_002579 [Gnomoniopsis smithogilvyi]